MKLKKTMNIFIISSVISLITIAYISSAYIKNKCPQNVPYGLFLIFIPLLYGIFGVINYYVINKYGIKYSFVIGMIFGLLLSLIGRFKLNLPQQLFNFTKKTEYKVHIYAIILYACIFQFIITPLTQYII